MSVYVSPAADHSDHDSPFRRTAFKPKRGFDHMKLLALSVATALFASNALAGLDVKIGSTQRGLREASGEITVMITNNSTEATRIERWNTPLDGVLDDLFVVAMNGEAVPYTGVHAKWGNPGKGDWIEFDAGQTMTTVVKLSDHYDMFKTGNYSVQFSAHRQVESTSKSGAVNFTELESAPAQLFVSGDGYSEMSAMRAALLSAPTVSKAAAQFQNCSATRQSQLNSAFTSAKSYATNSSSYFAGRTTANITARYKTWFGAATTSRISTAATHYSNIKNSLDNKQIVFNCSCASQYSTAFAYVNPNAPYTITLCGAFWPAGNTGTDSKAGTIIHETSHFSIVAGTDDNAYGQSAAKSLALSNPTSALNNADSHEYFSENTPAQN
jgi:peptidyl-Lys metalloendopeptidase